MKMYSLFVPAPITKIYDGIWAFIEPSYHTRCSLDNNPARSRYITGGAMTLQRVVMAALLVLGAYFAGGSLCLPIIVGIWISLPSTQIAVGGSLSIYGVATIFSSLLNINLISLVTGIALYLFGNVISGANPYCDFLGERYYFSTAAAILNVLGASLFVVQAIAFASISSIGIISFLIGASLGYSVEVGFGSPYDRSQGIFEKYFRPLAYYIYEHRYSFAGEKTFDRCHQTAMNWY